MDAGLVERLRATARALASGSAAGGPDLAAHLLALGPTATRGGAPAEFAAWLAAEAESLARGRVTPDLVAWLRDVLPLLRTIEADILCWLDGVGDFRYPLAQYAGSVSYVDDLVGRLVAALRERGIHDDTTIVFTSPHGEMLGVVPGEEETVFHHHGLLEGVLRVPAVVKPRAGASRAPGARIGGVLDLVDLVPTVLDAAGAPPMRDLAGASRWRHVVDGTAIPEHDSVAIDFDGAMVSVARGRHVLLRAVAPRFRSAGRWWTAGERALFETEDGTPGQRRVAGPPDVLAALDAVADPWVARLRGRFGP